MNEPTQSPAPSSQDSPAEPVPARVRVGAAPTIRVANRAIILRDDKLLVNVCHDDADGLGFYLVPGGGQEWGEDCVTALQRECREEIGCDVVVGDLAFVRDYVGANHRFAEWDAWFHQQENFFFCEIAEGQQPRFVAESADERQIGVAWVAIDDLLGAEPGQPPSAPNEFSPQALLRWLRADPATRPRYLGDVG